MRSIFKTSPAKTLFMSLTILLSLGVPQNAHSHARFDPSKAIKPRTNDDGLKSGPCGGISPTTDPDQRTTLIAGETIDMEWEETINHPGWFRIAFSPDGSTGFDTNVLKDDITDTQNGSVTRSDPSTYHKYKESITIPDTPCENCSIQLIQYMTEDPMNPSLYYSCADIRIVAADAADGEPPQAPTGLEVELIQNDDYTNSGGSGTKDDSEDDAGDDQ